MNNQRNENGRSDLEARYTTVMPELSATLADSGKSISGKPDKIGRYTIISELGRGGQGTVYRGLHPDLPIDLAIKVVNVSENEEAKRLLREEAKVLCELEHPNIARVRDLEVESACEKQSRIMLVMDYIRGRTLIDFIKADQLSLEQGCKWLSEIARALDHAHRRGILHLDLKPQNIVIDEAGNPTIIDFGLARVQTPWSQEQEKDGISGTLGFMSPEQAEGAGSKINARSDIYSLGGILYVILTGEPPIKNGPIGWMYKQATNGKFDREALSRSDAPSALKEVCLKAMSKMAVSRHVTAIEFADAIDSVFARNSAIDDELVQPPQPLKINWPLVFGGVILAMSAVFLFVLRFDLFTSTVENTTPVSLLATHIGMTEREGNDGEVRQVAMFEKPLFDERQTEEDDRIVLNSSFVQPQYCFLIRLAPDGEMKCEFPKSETEAQSDPIESLQFPDPGNQYAFENGAGAYGFILITSPNPLPSFNEWQSPLKELSWSSDSILGAWKYESGKIKPTYFGASRKVRPRIEPQPITDVLHQVHQQDDLEVHGVFFEVREKYE